MHTLTIKVNRKNERSFSSFLRKNKFSYELIRKSLSIFHVDCRAEDFEKLEKLAGKL